MSKTNAIEKEQRPDYPGLTVRRERGAVVVHVPMRFYRRNGKQMLLTPEGHDWAPERQTNRPLVQALAKAHRWQACPAIAARRRRKQIELGEYASMDDLARAPGADRTYVARMMKLTGLAPDIVEAILRGDEPTGISLSRLHRNLPVQWARQRQRWCSEV